MNQPAKPATEAKAVAVRPERAPVPVRASAHGALTVENLDGMWRLANALAKSTAIPKSLVVNGNQEATTGNIFVAVQMGAEVGIPPMQAVQTIAVINGMPSLWGDGMKAVARMSGVCAYIREGITKDPQNPADHTKWVAWCESERTDTGEKRREEFSWADAMRAKLSGKDTYQAYPQRMLGARARAWCLRDLFPDYLKGLRSAEEAIDIDASRDADGTWQVAPTGDRPETAMRIESERGEAAVAERVDTVTDTWAIANADGQIIDSIPDGPQAAGVAGRRLHSMMQEAPDVLRAEILEANAATLERLVAAGFADAVEALKAMAEPPAAEEQGDPRDAEERTAAKVETPAPAAAVVPLKGKAAKAAAPAKEPAPKAEAAPAKAWTEADMTDADRTAYTRIKARLDRAATSKGINDIWQYELSHGELSTLHPGAQRLLEQLKDARLGAAPRGQA